MAVRTGRIKTVQINKCTFHGLFLPLVVSSALIIKTMKAKEKAFKMVSTTFGIISELVEYKGIRKNNLAEFKKIEDSAKKIVKEQCKEIIKELELTDMKRGTWDSNFSELRKFWFDVINSLDSL